jgi:Kef-type K+ transport system membrane component KefB
MHMAPISMLAATFAALALVGFPLRAGLRRVGVPPALSLLAVGLLAGPAVANLLPAPWLAARPTLSAAAFAVLLLRAGLGIAPATLRLVAAPALFLGLLPVAAELGIATTLCHELLFDRWVTCLLGGFLVAAVSPAVVLPVMLAHKDAGRGGRRFVPDLIMGQTIVNAIVAPAGILFMIATLAPAQGALAPAARLALWPVAIVAGAAIGAFAAGLLRIEKLADLTRERDARLAALTVLTAALLVHFACRGVAWADPVVATLAFGFFLRRRLGDRETTLRPELRRVWSVAEIVLFANLGSAVPLRALANGHVVPAALLIIGMAVAGRLLSAASATAATTLAPEERRYVALAHLPKATIQAVFGPLPLLTFRALRPDLVPDGEALVVLAALAIATTAPAGALVLERFVPRAWTGAPEVDVQERRGEPVPVGTPEPSAPGAAVATRAASRAASQTAAPGVRDAGADQR